MADKQVGAVITRMRKEIGRRSNESLSDSQLLQDFIAEYDEAAFEVLVWRYASMVMGLCRRVLHDAHDAEDAFQAAFLILARKAGSIGNQEAIGSWLYKVAFRVAVRMRARSIRHGALQDSAEHLAAPETSDELLWRDLRPVLDEEINRLPEKYRAPFVLCYLQGQTNEQAALELGCPKGTILSRLARGREWLRSRLTRRGLGLAIGGLMAGLWENTALAKCLTAPAVAAPLPNAAQTALVNSTIKAAIPFAAGLPVTGLVPTTVITLTEGVLKAMFITKMKLATAVLMALALIGGGTGLLVQARADREQERGKERPAAKNNERGGERGDAAQVDVAGKVAEIGKDEKSFTIETPPVARGEEAKKTEIKLTDKTVITFSGIGPDGAKLTAGYRARVKLAEGSKDVAASVNFDGPASFGRPRSNHVGNVITVANGGTGITLGSGNRRGDVEKPVDVRFGNTTMLIFSGVGPDGAKPKEGLQAEVWLTDEPSSFTAKRVWFRGNDWVEERGGPAPDLVGRVTAVGDAGKTVTLVVRGGGRGEEPTKTEIKIPEKAAIGFHTVGLNGAKVTEGYAARVWLEGGSKDTAAKISFAGEVKDPQVVIHGKVSGVAADGKSITIEQPATARGEEPKKLEIKIGDKTHISFYGVGPNEAKAGTDFEAMIRLEEGSTDAAAEIMFRKGARGRDGRRGE